MFHFRRPGGAERDRTMTESRRTDTADPAEGTPPPHAAALQKSASLDELKAAWQAIPKALQPSLAGVKDDVKKFLSESAK